MNYYHININERTVISQLYHSNISIRTIAKELHRSPSTISREIRRNSFKKSVNYSVTDYSPASAQAKYEVRKANCGRKEYNDKQVIDLIKTKLEQHWSPEQIHGRLSMSQYIPCTSTIYRKIHQGVFKDVDMKKLRRKGHFKRPCETRGKFNDGGRTIKKRPKEVYNRKELGHWEGDTVESGRTDHKRKSKYCFVTLAERKSRIYLAILVPDRTSKNVMPAIINALKSYPDDLVKTITFDRGKEFSGYKEIEKELNCKTYFCDAYCAWQKGTNENSNGLLREFYPKGMDLSNINIEKLKNNLELMNNRPRKCLGYKTPNEVINGDCLKLCVNYPPMVE